VHLIRSQFFYNSCGTRILPVSVLNLDAPQLMGAIVTELLHYSQEALWAIAFLPTAFGKSTAVFS
jgi:hypothetical protein